MEAECWREEWIGLEPWQWPIEAHRIEFAGSGWGLAEYQTWLEGWLTVDESIRVVAALA